MLCGHFVHGGKAVQEKELNTSPQCHVVCLSLKQQHMSVSASSGLALDVSLLPSFDLNHTMATKEKMAILHSVLSTTFCFQVTFRHPTHRWWIWWSVIAALSLRSWCPSRLKTETTPSIGHTWWMWPIHLIVIETHTTVLPNTNKHTCPCKGTRCTQINTWFKYKKRQH